MVNVTIYSIHGSYMGYGKYGNEKSIKKKPTSSAGSQLRSTPWILQGLPAAEQRYVALLTVQWLQYGSIPIGSMYAIYGNIYHQYTPNVSINTIHGSYGIWFNMSIKTSRDCYQAKLSRFFYIFDRNHPWTSAMHPGGEIEGWMFLHCWL